MRTKTLVLSAVLGLASIGVSMAQPVYSLNVVGYVNTIIPSHTFVAFSNPLNAATNTLDALFGTTLPDGTYVYKYSRTAGTFLTAQVAVGDDGTGKIIADWSGSQFDSLAPGEGAFVLTPTGSPIVTNTFVGEVVQSSTNNVAIGFNFVSSILPQGGTFDTMGLTTNLHDGDYVYVYSATKNTYDTYQIATDGVIYEWGDTIPTIQVGQAFFVKTDTATQWVRNFSTQ